MKYIFIFLERFHTAFQNRNYLIACLDHEVALWIYPPLVAQEQAQWKTIYAALCIKLKLGSMLDE